MARFSALLGLLLLLSDRATAEVEDAHTMLQRILSNYGPSSIRPKVHAAGGSNIGTSNPEIVEVQFYIAQLRPLDMKSQTYGFDGYMRAWWSDPRLAFNGTAEGGAFDTLNLGIAERAQIWKPEFYWEGARSITMPSVDLGTGELIWVSPNGDVWWSRQVSFVMSCPFANGKNLNALPFDTQTCRFTIGMYSQTASEVYVKWATLEDGVTEKPSLDNWQGACLAEWHATRLDQLSELQVYVSSNYTYAHADINFTRAPAVWLWSYFMPALVLVSLSYLGFYIDPIATPARVTLGMLTVLVVMTLFTSLTSRLPPTVGMPWLARFMLFSFFFNVVAMFEQVLVSFGLSLRKWLDVQNQNLSLHLGWKEALATNKAELLKLFTDWDVDNDGSVSKPEFRRGVRLLGLRADVTEVNRVFDAIDADGDGTVTLSELDVWLSAVWSEERAGRRRSVYGESGERLLRGGAAAGPGSSEEIEMEGFAAASLRLSGGDHAHANNEPLPVGGEAGGTAEL
jgi:hypothetical protein